MSNELKIKLVAPLHILWFSLNMKIIGCDSDLKYKIIVMTVKKQDLTVQQVKKLDNTNVASHKTDQ